MADIFPDEGLDYLLSIVPKNGASPANLFLGLYTAVGGTSVPGSANTLAQLAGLGTAGFAEVSATQWASYTRQTHVAGSWGAQGASVVWTTTGRVVTGGQLAFLAPAAPYAPSNPIAGFFLASLITTGVAVYYSNFSDSSTIASLAIGDLVKVTPTFGFGNY
jgi:hypothetical protein